MSYDYFDISPAQYHAGLDKLWTALGVSGAQGQDVFTLTSAEIIMLRAEVVRLTEELQRGQNLADHPDFQKVSQRAEQAEAALAEAQRALIQVSEDVAQANKDRAQAIRIVNEMGTKQRESEAGYAHAMRLVTTASQRAADAEARLATLENLVDRAQAILASSAEYEDERQLVVEMRAALDTGEETHHG
jgi:hypothetical protein